MEDIILLPDRISYIVFKYNKLIFTISKDYIELKTGKYPDQLTDEELIKIIWKILIYNPSDVILKKINW